MPNNKLTAHPATAVTERCPIPMTHTILDVTTLVSTILEHSGLAHFIGAKSPPTRYTPTASITSTPELAEQRVRPPTPHTWLLQGRVRWSTKRVIIEWQTKQAATISNFAIYRSQHLAWPQASLVDLSIFATLDQQSQVISYWAVDTTVLPPGPYYYWIVNLSAKQGDQRFGPYIAQIDNTLQRS